MRTSVRVVLVFTLVLMSLLAACQSRPTGPQSVPAPAPSEGSAEATAAPASLDALEIELQPVERGFEQPLFVTHANDGSGRLFVVEQGGTVRVVREDGLSDGSFLDVGRRISSGGERGLLGLAFAPDYAESGVFYVNYTDPDGDTVVARFIADDPASDTPELAGPESVLEIDQPYSNHNGGCIMFEPGTQRLWVGMGDGGSGGDPENRAQNDDSLLGKMLVLDFSEGDSPEPEIVQKGLRNPWRFSFDAETNDLWIGDVGQNAWEEINFVPLADADGVNWGWNRFEGNHPYPPGADRSESGFTFPITEYDSDTGQSVTGGYVYRGRDYPELAGTYLYADYAAGWVNGLQRLDENGEELDEVLERTLVENTGNPASFGEDERGELYLCDWGGGTLYQVTATVEEEEP